jgi:hypothetical protein
VKARGKQGESKGKARGKQGGRESKGGREAKEAKGYMREPQGRRAKTLR